MDEAGAGEGGDGRLMGEGVGIGGWGRCRRCEILGWGGGGGVGRMNG